MSEQGKEQLPPGMPEHTEAVREPRLRRPPFWMFAIALIGIVVSWVPLVLVARARTQTSADPRIHLVQDMGTQPKYREQQSSQVFADGRADRPKIAGTVARGQLQDDDFFYRGFATGPDGKAKFFDGYPEQVKLKLNDDFLKRGQERFNIYCAVCHGFDGGGRGPVAIRSGEVGSQINPSVLTDAERSTRPTGHIYNTVNIGIRSMQGYGPQLSVEDRWAIVAYVKALQLSQNAPPAALTQK